LGSRDGSLDFKSLESKRGFLIYVTRTYPSMVPYLKGMHLTLDSWRPYRDADGWKLPSCDQKACRPEREGPPNRVVGARWLRADREALKALFSSATPPRRRARSKFCVEVFYGFGNASCVGSCTNFQSVMQGTVNEKPSFDLGDKVYYRYGHWCNVVSEESSNYRELLNLVESLELQVQEGRMFEAEAFLFTDNSTAETVFYKENSTSKKIFELVLRLRRLGMEAKMVLHVIHVAGTRMILEGAEGGSRGDLNQEVMAGQPILDFIPLHLGALDRSAAVEDWVQSWVGQELTSLTPEGWFDEGQGGGCFLWTPPRQRPQTQWPSYLGGGGIHKRPWNTHFVVVPRLMTGRWRRALFKEADLTFTIPVGTSFWPREMHEPLTVVVSFPIIRYWPWKLRGTPLLEGLARKLRPLWEFGEERCGRLVCQLLQHTQELQGMQEGMVREVLYCPVWESLSHPRSKR
jgi:hypothetical protein